MPPSRQDEAPEYPFAGPFPGLQSEVSPSQIGNAGFAEVQNLLFRNAHAQIVPEFVPVSGIGPNPGSTGSGNIMGFFDFFNVKGQRRSGVFTQTEMYYWFNGQWNKVAPATTDPSGSGLPAGVPFFTGDNFHFFQTAVVGYKLYFSNMVDPVQVWDGTSTGYLTADYPPVSVPGFTPTHISPVPARYLMELDFHLITGYTLEAGAVIAPNRIHWSGIGNGSDWSSFNAGQNDLLNNLGPITGLTRLFQSGYVFQQWGVTMMIPTGQGLAPFQFVTMGAYAKGNTFPYSLASFGELIAAYVGRDDIYVFDGTSSQPIGQHPVDGNRRLGARTRIFADLFQVSAFYDQSTGSNIAKVWGVITTAANGTTLEAYWLLMPELNKIWVYNFDESNWTQLYFQPGRLVGPAQTAFWAAQKDPVFNPNHPSGFSPVDSMVISDGIAHNASYLNFDIPSTLPTVGSLNATDGWYVRSGPLDFDDNRHPHTVNKLRMVLTDVATGMRFYIRLKNEAGYSTPFHQVTLGDASGEPITIMIYLNNGVTGKYITWELSGPPNIPFELVEITPYPIIGGEVMTRCEVAVGAGVGTISIMPGSATLAPGGTQQFTATVAGVSGSTAITWSATAGTISQTGLYTAPQGGAAQVVTVTATLTADPSVTASVQVSIQVSTPVTTVMITPIGGSLITGQEMQFSAVVTNNANTAVHWTASAGTIDQTGLYTSPVIAPGSPITVTITATSVADSTAAASVQVSVWPTTGAGQAYDLLQWALMPTRATQHLIGDPSSPYAVTVLDTDPNYPAGYPTGVIWFIKNKLGNPWDAQVYDNNFISHWITENGDAPDQPACQAANGTTCWLYAKAYKRYVNPVHVLPRYFIPNNSVIIDSPAPNDVIRTTDCEATSTLIHIGDVRGVTTGPVMCSWGGSIDKGTGTLATQPNYDNVNGVPTIRNQYFYSGTIANNDFLDMEEYYFVQGFGRVAWYYYHRTSPSAAWVFQNKTVNTILATPGAPAPNFPCGAGKPWWVAQGGGTPPPVTTPTYPNLERVAGWVVNGGSGNVGGTDPSPVYSMQQGIAVGGQTNTMQLNLQGHSGLWANMEAHYPPASLASHLPLPPSGLLELDGQVYVTAGTNAVANLSFDTTVASANIVYHMGWEIDYTNNGMLMIQDSTGAWVSTGISVGIPAPNTWHTFQFVMSLNLFGQVADRLTFTWDGTQHQIPGNVAQLYPISQAWADGVTLQLGLGSNSLGAAFSAYFVNLGYTYPP